VNDKGDLEEQVQQIQLQTHLLLELVEEVEVHFNQEEEIVE
jgi:hemerythrin